MSVFLQLPRELRDLIYEYYFYVDGGYTHNFASNKLRRTGGDPIQFNLTHVCRQIVDETRELPLRLNPIYFTTFHSEGTNVQAALLDASHKYINKRKFCLVNESASALLSTEDVQTLKKAFPQFAPIVDGWQSGRRFEIFGQFSVHCGEAPSLWHDFVAFTLDRLSQHPDFAEKAKARSRTSYEGNQASDLVSASPEPWDILDSEEVERLRVVADVKYGFPFTAELTKHAYSAAQVAIRFLRSIPATTCGMIRNITLLEDRESVATPASHGRGVIKFCQAHPQLKIERSVSLWKALFRVAPSMVGIYQHGIQRHMDDGLLDLDRCPAERMTKEVGTWIAEALLLPTLGMPKDAFTLILDGSPTPDHTSRVLSSVIQRDLAWQTALDISYTRGLLPKPSWLHRRTRIGYMYEGLPDAMHKLSKESSLIRTNFDFNMPRFDVDSPSQDLEKLLEDHREWTMQEWERGWRTHDPARFQTEAPLPPWHILRWNGVIM
ncbi:hypothetical protein P3342_004985 [Pyrenophora teres f. teres]|uniref:Uncharacterized protein n=1 Tax=Pyrenophora teres f. teres TaxID=97479 RepID=A0A6S6VUD7_9PLEO|nr:hypothetical protein HRS9139_00982 [Pyrenophora teres f. teres]KAE8848555.1 hypothetical protein PTNB85_02398 [Pyrenophora teres f. teres]KAE8868480.1 hypothetical protein PTNB29_02391 [Pyrenophora teres f. teres]KAE8873248.1 hypothetical protein PTNB73_02399 [Pyrenophora teres f. teres]KAK1913049.1 hypothetical protein P3342_004985 [Pyrenophora teres f. teres]